MSFVRRNYPRIPIEKSVIVSIGGRELAHAECRNISMGGMCISVKDTVLQDQDGSVELIYECENDSLTFKGEFKICWVKPIDNETQEFGFKFTYYDSTGLTVLARIVLDQLQGGHE